MVETAMFNVQRAITPKVEKPEYGSRVLHVVLYGFTFVRNFIIISRTVFNLQSGHIYMVEMAMFNVQRAITPKVGKTEYGSCVLHVVLYGFTFVRNFIIISRTVFNLQSGHIYMVEMAMFNVQRAITLKVGKQELRLICSARRLKVLYICVKFRTVLELWSGHE